MSKNSTVAWVFVPNIIDGLRISLFILEMTLNLGVLLVAACFALVLYRTQVCVVTAIRAMHAVLPDAAHKPQGVVLQHYSKRCCYDRLYEVGCSTQSSCLRKWGSTSNESFRYLVVSDMLADYNLIGTESAVYTILACMHDSGIGMDTTNQLGLVAERTLATLRARNYERSSSVFLAAFIFLFPASLFDLLTLTSTNFHSACANNLISLAVVSSGDSRRLYPLKYARLM